MEVLQHEHPLTLIDLNTEYPRDEVVYDDDEELIMKQDFRCPCGRCGQEINFYHRDCVFLRKKLLIQNFRKDGFFHPHSLTLAYSFPKEDQKAKFDPRCKICELRFDENLWVYKCEKCRFYVHTDCATTSKEASLSAVNLNRGTSPALKNYEEWIYTNHGLLHLPFPDQIGVFKHFDKESGSRAFETNLSHPSHRHPLTLVDTPWCNKDITTTPTSSRITSSLHDSSKNVEVVCNACIRPITNLPFYKCTASDDGCNFVLHACCTQLVPTECRKYRNVYKLLPKAPGYMDVIVCQLCDLICNGFVYKCPRAYWKGTEVYVDVHCALTPEFITHKSHPNHLLYKRKMHAEEYCRLCLSDEKKTVYACESCKLFIIHSECALYWPDKISHKYDKHQLTLRYFPVENYSGDYFCEVCEEEFNPNGAFYHCDQCVQSMHPACCASIRKKETTYTPFYPDIGVAQFDNVKFGEIFMVKSHPHSVSFCPGVESDGECAMCGEHLQDKLILKCLQCKFGIDKDCASRYDDDSLKPIV